jgi:hypothetical protein
MHTLVSKTWNRDYRTDKIMSILCALNRSGKVEITYFKEKLNMVSYYLRKGKPQPVNEDDEWDKIEITYNGIVAIRIIEVRVPFFSSKLIFDGRFFDEDFTESEIQQILDALKDVDILIYREYLSKKMKVYLSFLILLYAFFALHVIIIGSYLISILPFGCILILLWFLLHK